MGQVTQILTLPLAPVRGVGWVMQQVVRAAEEEFYDPGPVLQELAELEHALEAGEIDEETFDRREDELLERLDEIRRYREVQGA
ncbi:gas vesicle protein GvpG [Streptomyces sp. ISL-100]|uniref:gas vesicle protein GvpG n=1 Tax=Streptomyces sp. ISL-100 TaxID=2819173 RepID=UPI001BEB7836|nr:gas vesicle protein GvpG [Streptomyces sp. ISL-100]MBT2394860.1 gas vesicle protein GvpG [Streptomyces sp. ISL-100]